jgi:hypothetical protein
MTGKLEEFLVLDGKLVLNLYQMNTDLDGFLLVTLKGHWDGGSFIFSGLSVRLRLT